MISQDIFDIIPASIAQEIYLAVHNIIPFVMIDSNERHTDLF